MRQTFMDFLITKYGSEENKPENFYIWYSNKPISTISIYAEQWSSQQPEDEVLEALKALAQRHKWNGHGTGGCVCKEHLKAEEILAKHKERR